jgi:hypothetical protein
MGATATRPQYRFYKNTFCHGMPAIPSRNEDFPTILLKRLTVWIVRRSESAKKRRRLLGTAKFREETSKKRRAEATPQDEN